MISNFIKFLSCSCLIWLVSCAKESETSYLFTSIPSEKTGLLAANHIVPTEERNIIDYVYYYNGSGIATADFNNDSLIDILVSRNEEPLMLYLNQGNNQFKEVAEKLGLQNIKNDAWKTGVSTVDINNDGWTDISISIANHLSPDVATHNYIFLNKKGDYFEEASTQINLDFVGNSTQHYYLDYDNDGDLDLFLLNHFTKHDGKNVYKKGRVVEHTPKGDRFYENQLVETGNLYFKDKTKETGILQSKIGFGLSASVGDVNNDGWLDIYVCNDFEENDYLYINHQGEKFVESADKSFESQSKFSMGSDMNDMNNDGWNDLLVTDMKPMDEYFIKSTAGQESYYTFNFLKKLGFISQYSRNTFQQNVGYKNNNEIGFAEIGQMKNMSASDWSWSILAEDFNQDGEKDIFISNGILHRPNDLDYLKFMVNTVTNYSDKSLIKNMPSGKIENQLLLSDKGRFKKNNFLKNIPKDCSTASAVADFDNDGDLDIIVSNLNDTIQFLRNNSNEESTCIQLPNRLIGAKVAAFKKDKIYYQNYSPVRGFYSTSNIPVCFAGVDYDSILIFWAGKILDENLNEKQNDEKKVIKNKLEPISIIHEENKYFDYEKTPLMPYLLSREGPAVNNFKNGLLIGDRIVRDIDTDVFIAAEQKSKKELIKYVISSDSSLIVSLFAGNVFNSSQPSIIINKLENDTLKKVDTLEYPNELNISDAIWFDFSGDGIEDLVVSARNNILQYGERVPILFYTFENGKLVLDKKLSKEKYKPIAALSSIGEKIMALEEWGTINIFQEIDGQLKHEPLENSPSGWWRSVKKIDINKDGKEDFVFGNFGLNTNLEVSDTTPIQLYAKDFDRNGTFDPIMTYFRDGKEYTFANKDDITEQLVMLKKIFRSYRQFADNTFENLFPKPLIRDVIPYKANDLRSYVYMSKEDGEYEWMLLPAAFQMAPINDVIEYKGDFYFGMGADYINPLIGNQTTISGVKASYKMGWKNVEIIPFEGVLKKFVVIKDELIWAFNDNYFMK